MSFSSCLFLFIFFPIAYIVFHISPSRIRKITLLIVSLVFYALSSIRTIPVLLGSILINYLIALYINKHKNKKLFLVLGILFNILGLLFYKYTNFILGNINTIFLSDFKMFNLILPLGISFFTFQAISYLVDIYKDNEVFDKNIINFSLYMCFFPRIVSGPIVRYNEFKSNIESLEKPKINEVYSAIKRICFGLGKILILSSVMGEIWKNIYDAIKVSDISILTAWFGIICYSLQLYLEFSGYTDVALGVGRLFGIKLPENFDYPYQSASISEFWRRWHITLSSWFRDYVYIPLGGNRKGNVYFNLWVVFLLTGLWHGASWNFIFWGIFHGFWITFERLIRNKKLYIKIPIFFKRIATYLIILIGWVLFASNGLRNAIYYYKYMFGLQELNNVQYELGYFLSGYNICLIIISILISLPLINKFKNKFKNNLVEIFSGLFAILVLILSIIYMINSSYSPFIYAQF